MFELSAFKQHNQNAPDPSVTLARAELKYVLVPDFAGQFTYTTAESTLRIGNIGLLKTTPTPR